MKQHSISFAFRPTSMVTTLRTSARLFCFAGAAVLGACGAPDRTGLCLEEANRRLSGQVFRMDNGGFDRQEIKREAGTLVFRGAVVLRPGTRTEEMQSMECTLATDANDVPERVIGFRFDFHTGPASDETPTN